MFAINDANLDQYPQNLALKSTATKHRDAIHCVTFHPEKRCLLTGADYKRIIAWDSDTLQPIHKYKGHKGVISEICVIPGTDYVASASTDNTVKIWCLKTHKLIKTFQNHTASARFIRLVPYLNGNIRYLCSGGDDGKICFYRWNIQAKKFE
uniref:Uncharacterized protein n=1 Tax=Panagrolaimus sp. ES5 TaxID=591445 RepID=A0AC34FU92_9BILA